MKKLLVLFLLAILAYPTMATQEWRENGNVNAEKEWSELNVFAGTNSNYTAVEDSAMNGCPNDFATGFMGLDVTFVGFVSGEGDATYTWDFGDNTTGEGSEATHHYLEEGTYEVSLTTVLNGTCEYTSTRTIEVWDDGGSNDSTMNDCTNNFGYEVTDLDVAFTGFVEAEGDATYTWDFGDNTTGEGSEATHHYLEEGTYEVSLTTVLNGTCEYVSTRTIEVWDNAVGNDSTINDCTNNFGYEITDLNVAFTGFVEAEGDATYSWNFGDNTTGEGAEITHQYLEEGTYEVSLTTVLNGTCEYTSTRMVEIGGNACVNNFDYVATDLNVAFTGLVEAEGDATYAWNFGDNTTGEGAEATHEYPAPGLYEVSLTTVLNGTCEFTSTQIIEVWGNGGDNDSITNGCANDFVVDFMGLNLTFIGFVAGEGDATYTWNFGDNTTGEGAEVTHSYLEEGTYEVSLTTVLNDTCEFTSTRTVEVWDNGDDSTITVIGHVSVDNYFIDAGVVSLYAVVTDSANGEEDIVFLESVLTGEYGLYEFHDLTYNRFVILAAPQETSTHYETALPTYYGDVVNWVDATIITIEDNNTPTPHDINLQSATGTDEGICQITGNLVGEQAKAPLSNNQELVLHLLDENQNVLTFTYSAINNNFDFSNLAYGQYTIYTEAVGIPTYPSVVNLSEENPTAEIEIFVNATEIANSVKGIENIKVNGNVYPNPVNTSAHIDLNLLENSKVEIRIINQVGQTLEYKNESLSKGEHKFTFNTQDYPSGLYFIKVSNEKTSITQKFVK